MTSLYGTKQGEPLLQERSGDTFYEVFLTVTQNEQGLPVFAGTLLGNGHAYIAELMTTPSVRAYTFATPTGFACTVGLPRVEPSVSTHHNVRVLHEEEGIERLVTLVVNAPF